MLKKDFYEVYILYCDGLMAVEIIILEILVPKMPNVRDDWEKLRT